PLFNEPGHRIIAPLSYLEERGVTFIIEPNSLMLLNDQLKWWVENAIWDDLNNFHMNLDKPIDGKILRDARLVGIPIANEYTLLVWYLTENDEINRIIEMNNFTMIELKRP
ncbi:hypothetical protein K8I28_17060, partial [bacterium]|nr:hypothetical protein [bacterium]